MRMPTRKTALLACVALIMAILGAGFGHPSQAAKFEYTYKVHNKGTATITKLMASEDGKKYLPFDIGKGIKAGETATLVWDQSTDNGACEWWIKAVWSDGGVSPAAKFDFCEEDLVLEFE